MKDSFATKSKCDARYDQGVSSVLQAGQSHMNRSNSHRMNGPVSSPRFNSSNNDNNNDENNGNDGGFRISLSGIGKNTWLLNRKDFHNDNNTNNNNSVNNCNNYNNNSNNENDDYLLPTRLSRNSRSHLQTQRPSPRNQASSGNNSDSHYLTNFDENAGLSQEELIKRLKRRHSTIKTEDGLQGKRNNSIIGVLFPANVNVNVNVQETFNLGIPEDDEIMLTASNNDSSGSLIEQNGGYNSIANGTSNSLILGGASAVTGLSTSPQLATNNGYDSESESKLANVTMGADISPTPKSRVDMNVLSITEKRKLRQKRMTEWRVKMDNKIVCIVFAFFGGTPRVVEGEGW